MFDRCDDGGPPLVSALLPLKNPRQLGLARRIVADFALQTYRRKQLVVANGCGAPVLTGPRSGVREVAVAGPATVGELRNAALAAADGSWLVHWDPHVVLDPAALTWLTAHRRRGWCTLLARQVRFHPHASTAFLHWDPAGIAATIFQPRPAEAAPFLRGDRHDLDAYWMQRWAPFTQVLDNHAFPDSCLSTAFYDDRSYHLEAEFMAGRVGYEFEGQWELAPQEAQRLTDELQARGFNVRADRGDDAVLDPSAQGDA